jgi:predicted signal transduction protein with EAL and GGDEF domain
MQSSMGVAVAPHDGDCIEDLLRKADRELYQAKATRSRVAISRLPITAGQSIHDEVGEMHHAVARAE